MVTTVRTPGSPSHSSISRSARLPRRRLVSRAVGAVVRVGRASRTVAPRARRSHRMTASPGADEAGRLPSSGCRRRCHGLYRTIVDLGYLIGPLLLGTKPGRISPRTALYFTDALLVSSGTRFLNNALETLPGRMKPELTARAGNRGSDRPRDPPESGPGRGSLPSRRLRSGSIASRTERTWCMVTSRRQTNPASPRAAAPNDSRYYGDCAGHITTARGCRTVRNP